MKYKQNNGCVIFIMVLLLTVTAFFLFYSVLSERDTFNKYKSEDTPAATFKDALFSELRVESK